MNMTPMIDVVFLLLIFFMTVSQVSKINKERLDLPQQQGAEEQPTTSLTINVNRNGQIIVSGRTLTGPQLVSLVGEELARVGNNPNRVTIVLRADARGDSRVVNETVTSLNNLQITHVRIAVEAPN